MNLLDRLQKIFDFEGMHTPDWNAPEWNHPAGYEFRKAQRAMESAYLRLLDIEKQIDADLSKGLSTELGEQYEAGGALQTKARFASAEWRAAWQEFLQATHQAETASQHWSEALKNPPNFETS